MTTYRNFILVLLCSLMFGAAGMAWAQSEQPAQSLDQAVRQVQKNTGGRVLSAVERPVGRGQEYRIKVLTPRGHVKVVVVPSESGKNSRPNRSTMNQPARRAGGKEKR